MKIAVLSDIHGNLRAFEAVLADMASVGEVDEIWCLGDLAGFGPQPGACVERVRTLQEQYGEQKFKVIGGNTDRYILFGTRPANRMVAQDEAQKASHLGFIRGRDTALNWGLGKLAWADYEFMAKLPGRELRTRVDGYGMVIGYHGIPGDDESNALKPDSPDEEATDALLDRQGRMGIGGHTHLSMDRDLGRWRAVNPGSVGMSFRHAGMAEWALVTFENGEATVDLRGVRYDMMQMMRDIEQSDYPEAEWLRNFMNAMQDVGDEVEASEE